MCAIAGIDFADGEVAALGGTAPDAARRRARGGRESRPRCPCAAGRASPFSRPATNSSRPASRSDRRRSSPPTISSSGGLASAAGGGAPVDLGIAARRSEPRWQQRSARAIAAQADVLVTLGGASVGDYDLVQKALVDAGMELGFWKIAMRPGKPLMHGRIGPMRVLGLPGNPTSSAVCGLLFLRPLLRALLGDPDAGADPSEPARLGAALPGTASAQDYMRATLAARREGGWIATPLPDQDSSLVKTLARADALILRPLGAPAARAGEPCRIVRLERMGA